jgi:hypothetical protein
MVRLHGLWCKPAISVPFYSELHNSTFIIISIDVSFNEIKLLMFNNVQTTNLTFVGKI